MAAAETWSSLLKPRVAAPNPKFGRGWCRAIRPRLQGRGLLGPRRLLAGLFLMLGAVPALAGGGPENVLLVVNARSWASLSVANHWAALRQIPAHQILYLDWEGIPETVDVETFRERILRPILGTMERTGVAGQVDYVVYSSDLPYAVDCRADVVGQALPETTKPTGSLTSLTYLYGLVLSKNPNYLALNTNLYFRRPRPGSIDVDSLGFRSWYGWGADGELLETGGLRYLLSTMLAATSGRGNSLDEVVTYLRRSAAADGTRPQGSFVFTQTGDVRTTTRAPAFDAAIRGLRRLGLKGEIVSQPVPEGRTGILGLTLGTPTANWGASRSQFAPGAIADNLTSTGGVLRHAGSQTPLSEFLRYGAAGASGTVVEPYAIAEKFPSPLIHVHYARGCSLAESFYQSVSGPYQLIVVGDPLCRPWAKLPRPELPPDALGETISGTIELRPTLAEGSPACDRWELWVSGQRVAQAASDEPLRWDSSQLADGEHDLTLVAIEASDIETQGRLSRPVRIDNHGRRCEVTWQGSAAQGPTRVRWGEPISLQARSEGAERIAFLQGTRVVAQIDGAEGQTQLDPQPLGLGPVTLRPVAQLPGTPPALVYGKPLRLELESGPPSEGVSLDPKPLKRGLWLEPAQAKAGPIQQLLKVTWLEEAGVKPNETFKLRAVFQQPRTEMMQFQLRFVGDLALELDGQVVFRGTGKRNTEMVYVPVNLAKGWHRLRIEQRARGKPRLDVRFGGPGTETVSGQRFQYEP